MHAHAELICTQQEQRFVCVCALCQIVQDDFSIRSQTTEEREEKMMIFCVCVREIKFSFHFNCERKLFLFQRRANFELVSAR